MKKILIAVLAAAVLFGFAACEDGSSSTTSGVIAGATVTGGEKVYIPGETVDLNDYTFSITMADGTPKAASGSDFVFDSLVVPFDDGDGNAIADETITLMGRYKGMTSAVVYVPVKVAKVTALEVKGTPEVDEYYAATSASTEDKYKDDLLDLSGLTFTATYEFGNVKDGKREVQSDNKYLFATMTASGTSAEAWSVEAGVDNADNDNVVTVYFNGVKADGTSVTLASIEAKDTYDVTVIENLIKSVELKKTEGYTLYIDSAKKGAIKYTDDPKTTEGVYVEATYQNEEKVVLASTVATALVFNTENKFDAGTTTIANLKSTGIAATDKISTLYVKCEGLDAVSNFEKVASCPLDIQENDEVGFSVTAKAGFKAGVDLTTDQNKSSYFEVKVITADGETASTALGDSDFTVDASTWDFRTKSAGEVISVTISDARANKSLSWEGYLALN